MPTNKTNDGYLNSKNKLKSFNTNKIETIEILYRLSKIMVGNAQE